MDLFTEQSEKRVSIADGAYWMQGFALPVADRIWDLLQTHFVKYPPQTMQTPMGYPMSVRTTSFGDVGWVGTSQGYGYASLDVNTQQPWPAIPNLLLDLADRAARESGYADFVPDTCLVNVYAIGTKMGLHQDKDEKDFSQPIVSVSMGIPATFLFGGAKRGDKAVKIPLTHGDVVVWGGASRRFYHGIHTIKPNRHALLGELRCNLTFRKAL